MRTPGPVNALLGGWLNHCDRDAIPKTHLLTRLCKTFLGLGVNQLLNIIETALH